jgi:SAM-dependent methyltransferase
MSLSTSSNLPNWRIMASDDLMIPPPQATVQTIPDARRLGSPGGQYVSYLDRIAEELAGVKEEIRDWLSVRPGQWVLDVGCGNGHDVLRMAASTSPGGRAIGVDIAEPSIKEARARSATQRPPAGFLVASGARLPFADGVFGACRAERTLQHVPEPSAVLTEMLRVTKPGGYVLAAEPDHGMWAPAMSDTRVTRTLLHWWFDHIANPWIGRQLPGLFRSAGAADVKISLKPLIMTDPAAADAVTGLCGAGRVAAEQGIISQDDAAAWQREFARREADHSFLMYGVVVVVRGRKESR